MKISQISSLIFLFIISLGLSGTASHAGEIDDLKKRLLFLEAQKEIVKKLDGMQSNIDGLREKVDGFQNVLDDFRVQYDLKLSKTDVSNKNEKTKEVKKIKVSKIYKYSWKAYVCNNVDVPLTITADTKKLAISVFSLESQKTYTGHLVGGSDGEKYTFNMEIYSERGTLLDFTGNLTPSGGKAKLWTGTNSCGGEAKLVPVKN